MARILPGNYTFAGSTVLNAGTLQVDGSLADSALVLNSGTLSGTGTVGPISSPLGGASESGG